MDDWFHVVAGNTAEDGSREGVAVLLKDYKLDFTQKHKGLWLQGFIHPKEPPFTS